MATITAFQENKLKTEDPCDWKIADLTCSRCRGLMVIEQYADLRAQRCVQCGEVIDPVILQNRQRRLPIDIG